MSMHSRFLRVALALTATITLLAHPAAVPSAWADEIDDDAAAALRALYDRTPSARVLGDKAAGIVVFPNIVKAGFLVGAQFGDGTLFRGGRRLPTTGSSPARTASRRACRRSGMRCS